MVKYLLDTNVVSDLYKGFVEPPGYAFIDRVPSEQMWLSAITVGEIQKGCSALPVERKRASLQMWLDGLEQAFSQRVLAFNVEVAHILGKLVARTNARGNDLGVPDTMIAATALHHGVQVVTRNVKDIKPTGALLINPWEGNE
jgi:predicted nucleic acid-binding protein